LAAASWLIGSSHHLGSSLIPLSIAMPVWLFTGEMLARAITDRTRQLEHLAGTDFLTFLPNRRSYERVLARIQPGDAVVMIDLDHFKAVNDRHGHPVGDTTLGQFADVLRQVTRSVDCVARYGGDEFAMVLQSAQLSGAQDVLSRLRDAWGETDALPTFSAGIAVHQPEQTGTATVKRADAALYRAKAKGRHRVETAAPTDPRAPKATEDPTLTSR
jgi:diguanylate cyclase (GGDEF)-like protein